MSTLPKELLYGAIVIGYLFVEVFVGWLLIKKSPTLELLKGVGFFLQAVLYLIVHPKYLVAIVVIVSAMLGIGFLALRSMNTSAPPAQTSTGAALAAPANAALPAPTEAPVDTSVFKNADVLAVSEYTATVKSGAIVFKAPNYDSAEGLVEVDTQVRILGFDYTSEGWMLVQFDRTNGPANRWVKSFQTDLPDGSVALHQLPELVK